MAFFGASSLINAGIGGAIGGGMAMANGYDTAGILGGAVAGGAFGVLGGGRLGNWASRKATASLGSFKGHMGLLEAGGNRFAGVLANKGYNANSWVMRNTADRMSQLGQSIAKNKRSVNKWGSRAATLAGLGAASYIGSSMIGSNSGY
jgi:hypothetical protein